MEPFTFQLKNSLRKRKDESARILQNYPGRRPVICEGVGDLTLDKHKFLVPDELTSGQFLYVIRKRLKLKPEENVYLLLENNTFPTPVLSMTEVYKQHANEDGFLYIHVSRDTAFG